MNIKDLYEELLSATDVIGDHSPVVVEGDGELSVFGSRIAAGKLVLLANVEGVPSPDEDLVDEIEELRLAAAAFVDKPTSKAARKALVELLGIE